MRYSRSLPSRYHPCEKKPLVVILPDGRTLVIEDGYVTVGPKPNDISYWRPENITLEFTAEFSKYIYIPNGGYKRYVRYKEKLRVRDLKKRHRTKGLRAEE